MMLSTGLTLGGVVAHDQLQDDEPVVATGALHNETQAVAIDLDRYRVAGIGQHQYSTGISGN